MSTKVSYKGSVIANITESTIKTLKTSGKYCESDITIENTQDGGTTPSGSLTITANGTYDVSAVAQAIVNVAQSAPKSKIVDITLGADITAPSAILQNDAFLEAHHADPGFLCVLVVVSAQQTNNYILFDISGNVKIAGFFYGGSLRSGGSTNVYFVPKLNDMNSASYNGTMYYENGKLMVYATSARILGAGEYKLIMLTE